LAWFLFLVKFLSLSPVSDSDFGLNDLGLSGATLVGYKCELAVMFFLPWLATRPKAAKYQQLQQFVACLLDKLPKMDQRLRLRSELGLNWLTASRRVIAFR